MRISKHLHACLHVQEQGIDVLIDPGNYTDEDHGLDFNSLTKLDYIFYTHEHPDHFSVPLLKKLMEKFPELKIVTNQSIVDQLKNEKITAHTNLPTWAAREDANHEKLLPGMQMCENTSFTLFHTLTHPGDSLSFEKTAPVLALPVQAPWGSMSWAVQKALEMKPKVIIPIHDWHWKDIVRKQLYMRLVGVFKAHDIDFKPVETGEVVIV